MKIVLPNAGFFVAGIEAPFSSKSACVAAGGVLASAVALGFFFCGRRYFCSQNPQNAQNAKPIEALPEDVRVLVSEYLCPKDLLALKTTSKKMRKETPLREGSYHSQAAPKSLKELTEFLRLWNRDEELALGGALHLDLTKVKRIRPSVEQIFTTLALKGLSEHPSSRAVESLVIDVSKMSLDWVKLFPNLRKVKIIGIDEELRFSGGLEHFSQLEHLDLSNNSGDIRLFALLRALPTTQLRSLNLEGNCLCEVPKERIKIISRFTNLEELNISRNYLEDPSLEQFTDLKELGNLRKLNLSYNHLTGEDILTLNGLSNLSQITHLNLSNNLLISEAIDQLFSSFTFPNLEYLNLSNNDVLPGSRGLGMPFLQTQTFNNLVELNLAGICSEVDLISLNNSSFPKLEVLNLKGSFVGFDGVAHLKNSSLISQLVSLNLEDCCLCFEGASLLADASFQNLKHLNINGNWIDHRGIEALSNSSWFGQLESLDLSWNGIGALGLNKINKQQFKHIQLDYNGISILGSAMLGLARGVHRCVHPHLYQFEITRALALCGVLLTRSFRVVVALDESDRWARCTERAFSWFLAVNA